MKKLLLTSLFALAAAPVLAEPSCNPGETLKPVWESMKAFEEEGGRITSFKINDGGCYEVYGRLNEKKYEVFYDPNTGVEIERIED